MNRAFLVAGAECSGNRLVAGLFVSAGCWGFGSTSQPKIEEVPAEHPEMVVIAHLKDDLYDWSKFFDENHYDVRVIITARDPWVQSLSRSKASGETRGASRRRYLSDYQGLFDFLLDTNYLFTFVTYESLLYEGSADRFLGIFGLKQEDPLVVNGETVEIHDENKKWFKTTVSG